MTPVTPDRLSLNTATLREQWTLAQCIDGCARHGFAGIAPWRDKLQQMGVERAARAIADAGLQVSGLCRGGWYTAEGSLTREVLDDNRRAVDEAAAIGAACLVMVVGGLPGGSRDLGGARELVEEGLAHTLDYARSVGMPVAIEPLHPMYAGDRACVNTFDQALDLCDRLGDGIGVAIDAYHVWWDPALADSFRRCSAGRLLAVHLCDWLVPTRDLLTDRGMMGDGVIDLPGFRRLAEDQGYAGLYEVEIFSANDWWTRDPDEVMRIIAERAASVC